MRKHTTFSLSLACLVAATPAYSQSYTPLPAAGPVRADLLARLGQVASTEGQALSSLNASSLECATPPAANQLPSMSVTNNSMSVSAAAQLGFPVGSVNANSAGRVLVQDWSRTATCIARDGRTELVYGQAIRVVASAEQLSAEGGLSLPIIAAHATLNRQATNIQAQILGFNDPAVNQLAAQLLGPIDVTTFSTLNTTIATLASKASTAAGGTVVRLGVRAPEVRTGNHVLAAFAIQEIAEGRSCLRTKARFPGLTATQGAAIEAIYSEFNVPCSNAEPDPVSRARADVALMGVRIRK
jgi:hypothetical protein